MQHNTWKILAIMLVLGFLTGCRDSDVATRKKTTPQKNAPLPEVKELHWDLSPEEQNLKVGDWITVEGWQQTFIAASWDTQTKALKNYETGDMGDINLFPTPTGTLTSHIRIIGILAGPIQVSHSNETIARINNALLRKKETSEWGARIKIRVTAKISQINSEPRHQNKWSLYCFGQGVRIEY